MTPVVFLENDQGGEFAQFPLTEKEQEFPTGVGRAWERHWERSMIPDTSRKCSLPVCL